MKALIIDILEKNKKGKTNAMNVPVRGCTNIPPWSSLVLFKGGFVLPKRTILPVKSYQTDCCYYQRSAVAISTILITPVSLHLGNRGRRDSTLVATK